MRSLLIQAKVLVYLFIFLLSFFFFSLLIFLVKEELRQGEPLFSLRKGILSYFLTTNNVTENTLGVGKIALMLSL